MVMVDAGSTPFFFYSDALMDGSVDVVRVDGEEQLSKPYRFEIELVSASPDIDFDAVLAAPASLKQIRQDHSEVVTHGILCSFEQLPEYDVSAYRYRAVLVPQLWLLSLRTDNKIYQNLSVEGILRQALEDAGYQGQVEYQLGDYPEREYVVQYQESDLDFISRLMEHEGIFYFFQQGDEGETLVIADDNSAFLDATGDSSIDYRRSSKLVDEETVSEFNCIQRQVPRQVVLKDYNYRTPDLPLRSEQQAVDQSQGKAYAYGNHYKTEREGQSLAQVRAEEIKAGLKVFGGLSDCPVLRPGQKFSLAGHPRQDFNGEYVVTRAVHEAWDMSPLVDGQVAGDVGEGRRGNNYGNRFEAIPGDVPFRPKRATPKPRLHGLMNAKVDSAGDSKYADIDEQGRYKLIVAFDLSGNDPGQASRWMRMAQPYAGQDYGLHMPLHKGAEVVWACIDGDLDRPLICGAVPNPNNTSPVTKNNQTKSIIRTAGQNEIALDDNEGKELFYVHATRDMDTKIDHDETREVTNRRTTTIGEDERVHIGKNRTVLIDKGNDTLQIQQGNQAHILNSGNCTLEVDKGNRSVDVPAGTYQVTAQDIKLIANNSIEIVCGAGSIKMDASGNITINGINLKSYAAAVNDIKGPLVKINT